MQGTPWVRLPQSIAVTLPPSTWERVILARRMKGTQYRLISEAGYFRILVRKHYKDPIWWPDAAWMSQNEVLGSPHAPLVSRMQSKSIMSGVHAVRLLSERAAQDNKPIAVILRRLVRQLLEPELLPPGCLNSLPSGF